MKKIVNTIQVKHSDTITDYDLKNDSIRKHIRKILFEDISRDEANDNHKSIQTLIDKKRDVAFVNVNEFLNSIIVKGGLEKIRVPENDDYNTYVVYRKGAEAKAKELWNIAKKYGGYLSFKATDDDARRIGQLLSYKPSDIENYIERRRSKQLNINENSDIRAKVRKILSEEQSLYITSRSLVIC